MVLTNCFNNSVILFCFILHIPISTVFALRGDSESIHLVFAISICNTILQGAKARIIWGAILEKSTNSVHKLFCIFGEPILFSLNIKSPTHFKIPQNLAWDQWYGVPICLNDTRTCYETNYLITLTDKTFQIWPNS